MSDNPSGSGSGDVPYRADPTSPTFHEPTANPYAAPSSDDPYAAPPVSRPYPAYDAPPPAPSAPPSSWTPAPGTGRTEQSAVPLIAVSAVSMFLSALTVGIPGLVLGLIASGDREPAARARHLRLGWILYALNLLALVVVLVLGLALMTSAMLGP